MNLLTIIKKQNSIFKLFVNKLKFEILNLNNNTKITINILKNGKISYYSVKFLIKYLNQSIYKLENLYFFELNIAGLGYHVMKLNKNKLRFALGHNHFIFIKIPKFIKIFSKKNSLLLISKDFVKLSNFKNFILRLKPLNSYKEQGIYDSNKILKFKLGKQIKN